MRNLSFLITIFLFLFSACQTEKKYEGPSPVDRLMRDMSNDKSYSIILHDMEVDESKNIYRHQYKIAKNIDDKNSKSELSKWYDVSESFFAENLDNMGLELASKSPDGKITKIPAPPGFNGVVGNEKYGQWKTHSNGTSFWEFYGQYAFMSSMLGMMMGPPVYRSTYYDYNTYRGSNPGKPYYGTGQNTYGTNSSITKQNNPNFFQKRLNNVSSFKEKVASNPSRYLKSTSTNRTDSYNGRKSRSSSRSSSGSSYRSRGGRSGK